VKTTDVTLEEVGRRCFNRCVWTSFEAERKVWVPNLWKAGPPSSGSLTIN
jgi:hypothetical protein